MAREQRTSQVTMCFWRRRFLEGRIGGLVDAPKSGRPRSISDARIERVVTTTLEEKPPHATHWSTRDLAKRVGLSRSTIGRIWKAFRLQPHRVGTFKLSKDPEFIPKVRDVVGLYLNMPRMPWCCASTRSRRSKLDRTQTVLPMQPGRIEKRTHDYVRHGVTSLFAALSAPFRPSFCTVAASGHRPRGLRGRGGDQLSHPDEVVGRCSELEHPSDQGAAA